MYLALRLMRESDSNIGVPVKIASPELGIAGALFVFETREQAEEWWPGVEVLEVEFATTN